MKRFLFLCPAVVLIAFGTSSEGRASADPGLAEQIKRGQSVFMTCAACHGANGQGLPTNPPMAPALTKSKLVTGPPEVAATIVLKGIQKTDAKFLGVMLPLGGTLTDEQVADVLTFLRTSVAETKASAVSTDKVKEWREKYQSITQPLSRSAYEKKAEMLAAASSAAGNAAKESPSGNAPAAAPAETK